VPICAGTAGVGCVLIVVGGVGYLETSNPCWAVKSAIPLPRIVENVFLNLLTQPDRLNKIGRQGKQSIIQRNNQC
jgi:hypothetical protein